MMMMMMMMAFRVSPCGLAHIELPTAGCPCMAGCPATHMLFRDSLPVHLVTSVQAAFPMG